MRCPGCKASYLSDAAKAAHDDVHFWLLQADLQPSRKTQSVRLAQQRANRALERLNRILAGEPQPAPTLDLYAN